MLYKQCFNLNALGVSHKTPIDFNRHRARVLILLHLVKSEFTFFSELLQGPFYFFTRLSKMMKSEHRASQGMGFTGIFRRMTRLIKLSEKCILILLSYCSVIMICTIEFYAFFIAIKGNKCMKYQTILGHET